MNEIKSVYQSRIDHFTVLQNKIKKRTDLVSNFRFLVFGLLIVGNFLLYKAGYHTAMAPISIFGIIIFIVSMFYHESLFRLFTYYQNMLLINNRCSKRLTDEWVEHVDTGEEFVNKEHPFSADIDLFGKNSIYQWINAANTFAGRSSVARILSSKPQALAYSRYRARRCVYRNRFLRAYSGRMEAKGSRVLAGEGFQPASGRA